MEKTRIQRPILALISALSLGLGNLAWSQDEGTILEPYRVNPGDILEVSVWKEEGLERQVLVRPDGMFSFPLAGDIQAHGETVEQIRQRVTDKLSRYIPDLVVTVSTQNIGGNKVYVIGQVNRPGEIVANPRVDVMQALSVAGGTTPFADLNGIRVLRRTDNNQQVALRFNYGDVSKGKNLEQNIVLQAGDVVVVP